MVKTGQRCSALRRNLNKLILLTRDNISGIERILVFDETKAIHQLDLDNLAGAMLAEVGINVGLGGFGGG